MQLPSPTGKRRLLAKGTTALQQLGLPTASVEAVGKAGRVLQGKPIFANSLAQSCWQSWQGW
jgi:hypothetical protein